MKRAELVSTFLKEDEHKDFSMNSIVGVHVSCYRARTAQQVYKIKTVYFSLCSAYTGN